MFSVQGQQLTWRVRGNELGDFLVDPKNATNLIERDTNTSMRIFDYTWLVPRKINRKKITIRRETVRGSELIKFTLIRASTGMMYCDIEYVNDLLINTTIKFTIPGNSSNNTGDNTGDDTVEDEIVESIMNETDLIEIGNVMNISANNFDEQGFVRIPVQIKYNWINPNRL